MPSPPKKPRRTAERILEVALAMFNRFGEPNVSTTAIATELNISPGNLYYHFPAKETLVNALFDRYRQAIHPLLDAGGDVRHVEDAWLFFHMLFELLWEHRFLYRDLNDLLSKNRHLETQVQELLDHKSRAVRQVLDGLARGGVLQADGAALEPVATAMVVVLTYWLSYEYVQDPRHALEPEAAGAALLRGAFHVLSLVMPYLQGPERNHLLDLVGRYHAGSPAAPEGDRHGPLDPVSV